jgi:putative ABC transport system permease protein
LEPDPFVLQRSQSSELTNLDGLSNLPNVGAGLLALVAAGTLVHTLATSVRRRRRDFAILRALGFTRRQVRATIAFQATTIIAISLAIGLPLGAMTARWAWRVFAQQLGYVALPIIPLVEVLAVIPIAIVLANVIASVPAGAAARAQPTVALRTE